MRIAVRHLEVFDDLAFVPDVISGGHHVDTQIEKLFRQRGRDSESSRGIFAVGDDQIRGVPLAYFGQAVFYDRPPGAPKNVTDKKNFQESGLRCWISGTMPLAVKRERPNFDGTTLKIVRVASRWPMSRGVHWVLGTGYWVLISAVFRKSQF